MESPKTKPSALTRSPPRRHPTALAMEGNNFMPVLEKRTKEGPEKSGAIVSNGTIGRRLLNVEEAAQYLGLSVDTLHKWVQLRAIPHVKAGRALRFDLAALNRYIDEHTIGTID